jgi:SAM-dependent methyltransferase
MAVLSGKQFFEGAATHRAYQKRRDSGASTNDLIELPAFDDMVGDVQNLDVFDLGCGDGRYGQSLLGRGCRSYAGVDASSRMVEAATRHLAGTPGRVTQGLAEDLVFQAGSFDLVVSRMTLHWLRDVGPLFTRIAQALRPSGRLVFSVQHPVITCSDRARAGGQVRSHWLVDEYFVRGPRVAKWFDVNVEKFHRTTEDYFRALRSAGFVIDDLREAAPSKERFPDPSEYEKRQKVPLILLMSGRRPASIV